MTSAPKFNITAFKRGQRSVKLSDIPKYGPYTNPEGVKVEIHTHAQRVAEFARLRNLAGHRAVAEWGMVPNRFKDHERAKRTFERKLKAAAKDLLHRAGA